MAFDRNIQGKFTYLPKLLGMEVVRRGGVVFIDSALKSGMFNILYCEGNAGREEVRAAIEYFRTKGLPYAFWIGFEGEPEWLEGELQACGLISEERELAMKCDLGAIKFSELPFDIRRLSGSVDDLISVMNSIMPQGEHEAIEAFFKKAEPFLERGSLTFFVGYEDGSPVSLSSCYSDQGIASVFDVIVLPDKRGKGLGKAMTLAAMRHAKELGIRECVLTATNDAKVLYQKIGFVDIKEMRVYQDRE